MSHNKSNEHLYLLYNAQLPNGDHGVATVVVNGDLSPRSKLTLKTIDPENPSNFVDQVYVVTSLMPSTRYSRIRQRRIRPDDF